MGLGTRLIPFNFTLLRITTTINTVVKATNPATIRAPIIVKPIITSTPVYVTYTIHNAFI